MSSENIPVNGVAQSTLLVISSIMGGGIVAIPFSFAVAGITVGFVVQIVVILYTMLTCKLYLETRAILGCKMEFSTIAQICLGNFSVLPDIGVAVIVYGAVILYMILFANTARSLIQPYVEEDSIWEQKVVYIVIVGIVISPLIVKKRM